MKQISLIIGLLAATLFSSAPASAQVSVTYNSGYGVYRPSVTVSVGNNGYYQNGYPSYPNTYPVAYPNTYPVVYPAGYPVSYPVRVRGRGRHRGYYQQQGYQTCNQAYWCQYHNQYCNH